MLDGVGSIRVPSIIKRNTALFALSQSFTGAGMQFAYGLGPLMVLAVTDSPNLSGLSVAIMGISRFLVSYPVGKVTDRYGRKPGITLGLALALVGALVLGFSIPANSLALLVCGLLVFGMGMSAAQQMRVAATDMYPPAMRAQALGYVAFGSLCGLVLSPFMIEGAERAAAALGEDPLGLAWFLMPVLILIGMALVNFVRPDPMKIGMELERYYPGYVRVPGIGHGQRFSAMRLLRDRAIRTAIIMNSAGTGNMSVNMVLTSLILHHHGHSLSAIAASHMFHTVGMFGFTIPLGRLADRIGRQRVMIGGVVAATLGAGLVTLISDFWAVTVGTFLSGAGWAAANVASAALIADRTDSGQRGRAIGLNDSFAGAMTVTVALLSGPLIAATSLATTSLMGALVTLLPLVIVGVAWLRKVP